MSTRAISPSCSFLRSHESFEGRSSKRTLLARVMPHDGCGTETQLSPRLPDSPTDIESLTGNFVYLEETNRAVAVHSAAIIEALRKLYDAPALASELEEK